MLKELPFTGEKHDQLEALARIAAEAGVFVPAMEAIDQEVIDDVLFDSSLPTIDEADDLSIGEREVNERLVVEGGLLAHLTEAANGLVAEFGGPLILRSSARGDATGNGVYLSARFSPLEENVRQAFTGVVSSYFSESARIFRDRAKLRPGFAAFMQPLVGRVIEGEVDGVTDQASSRPTRSLFLTSYSGNARMATPLYPIGSIKLQRGLGCAVALERIPRLNLDNTDYDDDNPVTAMQDIAIDTLHRRSEREINAVSDPNLLGYSGQYWDSVGDLYRPIPVATSTAMKVGQLREKLIRLNSLLGNNATYYEFVVHDDGTEEKLYIVQKGDIAAQHSELRLDQVKRSQVIIDGITVEAGNGSSPTFDTIVCTTSNKRKDLYDFDKSAKAKGGYLLAFPASATEMKRFDITRLRNAKAFITFQDRQWAHANRPEDHIVGYSDQLGIPMLSITRIRRNDLWGTLTGALTEGSKTQRIGVLDIRHGKFQVVTEPGSRDGLIIDLER